MAYKRCHTISDASGLGVIFVIICHRCYRVSRIAASSLLYGSSGKARIHRETPIQQLQERVVCKGDADTPGCGHRGGRIYMRLDWSCEVTDRQYVTRWLQQQNDPKQRRRWP